MNKKKVNLNLKLNIFLTLSVFLVIFLMNIASAVTIFSDNFEDGDMAGWTLSHAVGANDWTNSALDPNQGARHANSQPQSTSEPASVMERIISTVGYQNITLSYSRKLVGLDAADKFEMEWNAGSGWNVFESVSSTDDTSYVYKELNLSAIADDNPNFQIKFECTAGAVSEHCRVDDILITGNVIVPPDTTSPLVTINFPTAGAFYNTNNLPLNFNVSLNENGSVQYSLNNGINISMSGNQGWFGTSFNASNGSIADGIYTFRVYANDTNGNKNYTESRTFTFDSTIPLLSITYPKNISYNSVQTQLNYSVSDINLQSCWYTLNGGVTNASITCGNNISELNSGEGSSTWRVYANDSAGNVNSSSVTFFVDTIAPSVSIILPQEGSTFGVNTSLALNYTASDTNLQSCWYSIDNGANVTIANCLNTTFNTSSGSHNIKLYANDSLGNSAFDSKTFSIQLGAPSISLSSPVGGYLNSNNVNFFYTATDPDLNSCELWGNFTGVFALNQTNSSVVSGQQSSFSLNLADGGYMWNVKCNDTLGNSAFNGNKTFHVDTIKPSLTLSEPTGTKTSRENIPITFSASDLNIDRCWYNVYRGSNEEIANTSVNCNGAGSFNVTIDANFVLNLYVNDSAGNVQLGSTSFSVSTSSGEGDGGNGNGGGSGGGSSGGGSGGGGGFIISSGNRARNISLVFLNSKDFVVKRGDSVKEIAEVQKTGGIFLNRCKLQGGGLFSLWISDSLEKGISIGEKYIYGFNISVPSGVEPGLYNGNLIIKCEEGESINPVRISVYRDNFEGEIENYERVGSKLRVFYNLKENARQDHSLIVGYTFSDFDDVSRATGNSNIVLGAGQSSDYVLEFELPKDSFGEFSIKLVLGDGSSVYEMSKEIFLPSRGALGLAISDEDRRNISILGIVIISFIALFFISRFFYRKYKKNKIDVKSKLGERIRRKVINLDLYHS